MLHCCRWHDAYRVDDDGGIVAEAKTDSEAGYRRLLGRAEGLRQGRPRGRSLTQACLCRSLPAMMSCAWKHARSRTSSAMRNKPQERRPRHSSLLRPVGTGKCTSRAHIRALLSSRRAVLDKCVDLEIRGLFKVFGIKLPPRLGHGSFDAKVRPRGREGVPASRCPPGALGPSESSTTAPAAAHADPVCQRLMTALGFGRADSRPLLTIRPVSRTVAAHFALPPGASSPANST